MAAISQALIAHQEKADRAKRHLQDDNGEIRMGKEGEWALLEIADLLRAIHLQLQLIVEQRGATGQS